MQDNRNAFKSESLTGAFPSSSGYLVENPLNNSGVSVSVNEHFSRKKPKISARIPPPLAEMVPAKIQVTTDAAILSWFV